MKRVLITGAAGRLGRSLRASLQGIYPVLRLSDVAPLEPPRPGEEIDTTDLTDFAAVQAMMAGVDAVVHLGGVVGEAGWKAIVDTNITGTYNVFEAARIAGIQRVVYASSNHAVGFYPRTQRIDASTLPLPDSRYGVSKAVGESLGALYAYKHGIKVSCLRIGNFNPKPLEMRHLSIWVSPRDLAQLVRIGLEHPAITYEIMYGVSGNTRTWWDNANATRLGYAPRDNSEDFLSEIASMGATPEDPIADRYQGGKYCIVP